MSNLLGINELVVSLDRFKDVVGGFATREQELTAEYQSSVAAETKAFVTERWNLSTRLTEGIGTADAALASGKQAAQARFEARTLTVRQAHRTSRKRALDKIEEWEGRRKYHLQKNALDTDRRRESELATANARLAEFQQKLADSQARLETLAFETQLAFRGYGSFRHLLTSERALPGFEVPPEDQGVLEELTKLEAKIQEAVERFRRRLLPLFFGYVSVWLLGVLVILAHAAAVPLLRHYHVATLTYEQAGISCLGSLVLLTLVFWLGRCTSGSAARNLVNDLAKAQSLHDICLEKAQRHFQLDQERIQSAWKATKQSLDQQWNETVKQAAEMRDTQPQQIDDKANRISHKHEALYQTRLARLDSQHRETVARLTQDTEAKQKHLAQAHEAKMAELSADYQRRRQALAAEWKNGIESMWQNLQLAQATADQLFPAWEHPRWASWSPPTEFHNAAKFGELKVAVDEFTRTKATNRRLPLPCPTAFEVPLLLTYPREGSILFETGQAGGEQAVQAINNIIYRLLSTTPPGKLSFTIIDPVGLGQSFAGLMHLADYSASYIDSRIWTQTQQIEEKLAELNEHMEKVIQMYLRNEYPTIAEYNAQAGSVAEKYHLLVIAGFPVNFSEMAGRRLLNIAASGARCGVYTLIQWDQRHALPHDFVVEELRKNSICLVTTEEGFALANYRRPGARLVLDPPPSAEFATAFLHQVGESSRDSNRVEVPFEQVAPAKDQFWSEETTDEVRVALGRSGATKLQYLAIGKGTRQHALIAGKTGSGKSTLFHVIITNLALWCSPQQVEFYLVDFKKGVEFKCYATRRLPHARVVAIESDREFGLSVLQRVDEELRRRGDLFRHLGVQDLAGYKRAGGTEILPRSLLIIDEFQEFFVEEDRIAQNAAVLLDRIVRQGRAFGIHVLLGSQTLGGAYTLARATLGQMVIRIALQCNEADAYLIMDESNAAPRLLSRPGEGIYNDAAGALEGNSPFQTVWLSDDVRDGWLAKIRAQADRLIPEYAGPIVFEGNAPADVRENRLLQAALANASLQPPPAGRIWLGAPNSIKGPTEAVFQRQSGNHLLLVGQRDESALAIISVALISLAAQYPPEGIRLIFLDSSPPGSPQREFLDRVVQAIPHRISRPKAGDLAEVFSGLAEELKQPVKDDLAEDSQRTFLFIYGLENFKKLRQEDEFSFSTSDSETGASPGALLVNLINEGPSHGFHVIATCDTYNNVTRFLGRKALSDIAMRVAFQMSATDSASLIETPNAATLGLHRALFYNEREGYLETFRPYALPGTEWLEQVARELAARRTPAGVASGV